MPRRLVDPDDLVGVAEVARLSGCSSQAVVNWQARHEDFPKPVADLECGPVFNWHDVHRWLQQTGRMD